MALLVLGLVLFLGVHSLRVFAPAWRDATAARLGAGPWKAAYSVASIAGFALIVVGYGAARANPIVLWQSPLWMRHVSGLLMLASFILLAAAYVPGNQLKARFGHPMVLGVKTWAFAHLLAHGWFPGVLVFGGFLAWAVLLFITLRRRDRSMGVSYPPGRAGATVVTVVVGAVGWAVFAFWLHGLLIGVRPFG